MEIYIKPYYDQFHIKYEYDIYCVALCGIKFEIQIENNKIDII